MGVVVGSVQDIGDLGELEARYADLVPDALIACQKGRKKLDCAPLERVKPERIRKQTNTTNISPCLLRRSRVGVSCLAQRHDPPCQTAPPPSRRCRVPHQERSVREPHKASVQKLDNPPALAEANHGANAEGHTTHSASNTTTPSGDPAGSRGYLVKRSEP